MSILLLVAVLALNLLISWYNAKICGQYWSESKTLGGFIRVLMWCGAIQSAIGFSSVLIVVEVFAAYATGHLSGESLAGAMSLWYLAVIIPALGSGIIITVHSWVVAWRERSWSNMGTAAWNTFATGHNLYQAANGGVSKALDGVKKLFDGDNKQAALVILLVAISLLGGAILTATLISHYDRKARRSLSKVAA